MTNGVLTLIVKSETFPSRTRLASADRMTRSDELIEKGLMTCELSSP